MSLPWALFFRACVMAAATAEEEKKKVFDDLRAEAEETGGDGPWGKHNAKRQSGRRRRRSRHLPWRHFVLLQKRSRNRSTVMR